MMQSSSGITGWRKLPRLLEAVKKRELQATEVRVRVRFCAFLWAAAHGSRRALTPVGEAPSWVRPESLRRPRLAQAQSRSGRVEEHRAQTDEREHQACLSGRPVVCLLVMRTLAQPLQNRPFAVRAARSPCAVPRASRSCFCSPVSPSGAACPTSCTTLRGNRTRGPAPTSWDPAIRCASTSGRAPSSRRRPSRAQTAQSPCP